MFSNEYPQFIKKHILKIEMLENLRDFPRDYCNIKFKNYGNGILSGCEVFVKGQMLEIQPGMLIFDKILYMLREPVRLPYQPEEEMSYLKVRLLDKDLGGEQISYTSQIFLDAKPPKVNNELEFGRFLLQKGSQLRDQYVDFTDYMTRYDTLIRIYVPYSCEGGVTVWPELLKRFAKEAMKYRLNDYQDAAFCTSVLSQSGCIPDELITAYLNAKLQQDADHYSNEDVFQELHQILENLRYGKNSALGNSEKKKKIMLV